MLAQEFGKRVLLVDLDSQSNLTAALIGDVQEYRKQARSIYHLFRELLQGRSENPGWDLSSAAITPAGNVDTIRQTRNLSVVISLPELGQFDEELIDYLEQRRGDRIRIDVAWRKLLQLKIKAVRGQYDYIIIDCPPSLSLFTSNALIASDYFITPMAPEFLSMQGLDLITARLGALRANSELQGSIQVKYAGTIVNRVDIRRGDHQARLSGILGEPRYYPFRNWIGDHKPMYLITDYDHPAQFLRRRWRDLQEKMIPKNMGKDTTFKNPRNSLLRYKDEGDTYTIFDRVRKLTEEFVRRCK